ncbi:hypothetical protein [Staphylococcus pasteuri]|uniref:hypothetical protein n=1 Tax=Staphylococcus pasteuri TaxID=45972 RepID=UPI000F84C902|nr:hypothetical protein [Staphylococcus pasteuri]MEB6612631.1 hypothetical protein [Staphylococcus pasteuri]QQN54147.1 hypothetical protein I6I26_00420 [Staphylococcus pasteuri]RTX76465.1 hypothetical protein CD121_00240 [Staphylococcus pasteuri]
MKFFKLDYQHNKDIVDDNVLTMFVIAKNKDEVEEFAKKVGYSVENIKKLSQKEFDHEKEVTEHYRLEHADQYL